MICFAMVELYKIAYAKQFEPVLSLGIFITLCYTSAVTISTQYSSVPARLLPEMTLLFAFFLCFIYYFAKGVSPLKNLSIMFFSIVYLVIPLSCMISIVYFFKDGSQDGRFWLFYTISIAKMTDMGGYFFGKQFGKHPLALYISPKKTWEGALGGVLIAIVTSWLVMLLANVLNVSFSLSLWQSIWLGILIAIVAQVGDLAESLLKRDGGIKDSSHLPGLGGILDIVDSLIFATPLVYIFLKLNFLHN
jgi:phosphatidate cytidylyltransferase